MTNRLSNRSSTHVQEPVEIEETLDGRFDWSEKVDGRAHDDFIALIEGEAAGPDHAIILARIRLAYPDHFNLGAD